MKIDRSIKPLNDEMYIQLDKNYSAFAIALYNQGWRAKRINNIMERTTRAWDKCANDDDRSMIQILHEATGVEIMPSNTSKHYYEVPYLNGSIDFGKLSDKQYLYMRGEQRKWIGAQVVACFLYALHVHDGWGFDRLANLVAEADEIKKQYKDNPKTIKKACKELTGVEVRR